MKTMLAACLATLTFLLGLSLAHAAPAAPGIFNLVQPDGSVFKTRLHGDEFQNWREAVDSGHTVIRDDVSGYWTYAEKRPDGSLTSSGLRVDPTGRSVPTRIEAGLRPPRDLRSEQAQTDFLNKMYQERLRPASGPASNRTSNPQFNFPSGAGWVPQPIAGERKLLVVLVGFSDRAFQTSASSWYNSFFNTDAGVKSVANYYRDNSFGLIAISPAAHTQPGNPAGVVTVTLAQAHPNPPSSDVSLGQTVWVAAAINAVDQYVHFSSYDSNGNGAMDTSELLVYFIVAGYDQAYGWDYTPSIYPHATHSWWGALSAAGTSFPDYALNGELGSFAQQSDIGTPVHELGHQMGGFPDLYDRGFTNKGMGSYSMMGHGSWGYVAGEAEGTTPVALDAWTREFAGWGAAQTPVASGALSLGPALASAGNAVKLINPAVSTTEYWLLENRYPTGWDAGLTGLISSTYAGGLLIMHVDLMVGKTGEPGALDSFNTYVAGLHQGLVPEQAKTTWCDMLAVGSDCYGEPTTLYYKNNNARFALSTTPNSNYYSGDASGFQIYNISERAMTMSADLVVPGPPGAPTIPTEPSVFGVLVADSSVTLSFSAPASDGGAAITSYAASCTGGPSTPASGASSPLAVTGMSNGTPYACSVLATNSVGNSPVSAVVNATPASSSGATGSLTSTFAGGWYGANGNMLDVKALNKDLRIQRFDLNLWVNAGQLVPVNVYYKAGSYVGYEATPSAWTLLGSYSVTSAGSSSPSSLLVDELALTRGQSYGIYLTATDGSAFSYTSSANAYSVANADLQITLGAAVSYPFGTLLAPRAWNGTVYYATALPNPPTGVSATPGNATAVVSWTASQGADSYQVTGSPSGACSAAAPSTSCTVTGLTNGLAYTFTVTASNVAGTGAASEASNSVTPLAPRLINLSTRGPVLTGDNVMIGGFIIGGSTAKTVLIRAVGPNLANYGVPDVLANPKLDLYAGQTVIASNDDWGTAANAAAIAATGLAPVSPRESAILMTLPPGAYTAIVSGVGGGTGVGIVEVFAQ